MPKKPAFRLYKYAVRTLSGNSSLANATLIFQGNFNHCAIFSSPVGAPDCAEVAFYFGVREKSVMEFFFSTCWLKQPIGFLWDMDQTHSKVLFHGPIGFG